QVRDVGVERLIGEPERSGQADDAGDVLRAGPSSTLVGATVLLRVVLRAAPDVERAGALRTVQLVRGDRHKVDAEPVYVKVEQATRLAGVDVERDLALAHDFADLADGLD